MKLIEHFVGGKIIPGTSDKKGKVFNPATGEQEKEVRLASKVDLDQAVQIAQKAFEEWSTKPSLSFVVNILIFVVNPIDSKYEDNLKACSSD